MHTCIDSVYVFVFHKSMDSLHPLNNSQRLWIQVKNTYSIEEIGLHGRNNGHQIYNNYVKISEIKHLESIQKTSSVSDGWYAKDLAIIMGMKILNLCPPC